MFILMSPVAARSELMDAVRSDVVTAGSSAGQIENIVEYLRDTDVQRKFRRVDEIVQVIKSSETEDVVLSRWLKQFRDNIFFLDKENEKVVGALLDLDWTSRSQSVVRVYQELILNLVSAHTYYLFPVMMMIIRTFSKVLSEGDAVSKEESECYQMAHRLLREVVNLIPLAPNMLCSLLNEKFPYLRRPPHLILCYVENMLQVTSYLPVQRLTILEDLFDKYLQIDVHCPRDAIEMWELEREENEQECDMEIDVQNEDMAYPLANTLDILMQSIFKFTERICCANGSKELNWDATKKLFRELLTVFDKLILPTHHCSHVQFIMFYICSLKPALCEGFLDYLWKKVKNPNTAPVHRQTSTFYIGSLLSRALYIPISTVCACLELMCSWVHSYIQNHDSRTSTDGGAHGTFHCVCQTLFYVFAFRHKELIGMLNGYKYLRNLNFERIVTCRLNPLKFCHPVVVQNFASVARNYQIAYCYPVIERNNRCLSFGVVHSDNFAAMNTFFPFDPYQLTRSKKWIEPLYRRYDSCNEDDSLDKEGEDESFLEEAESHSGHGLFSYSSSPGFKQQFHALSPKVR